MTTLLLSVFLFILGTAGLPASGGPYIIENQQTGYVLTIQNGSTALPGAKIIGMPLVSPSIPSQQWLLNQVTTIGNSGFYTLTALVPSMSVFVNGVVNTGLTVQPFASPLNVTELRPNSGIFFITFPTTTLSATTSTVANVQLTLTALNTLNPLEEWSFILQGPDQPPQCAPA
ncbi:hypothetical protein EXIGLDRAFT_751015 [Exidia glandulosa HHB12029]|uniref:Ricin B lectin domain-containing protein n=1 Tax=Exidia glandulosa HHB12029 TaxID=1314781 RepID=A0A165FYS2_EXIGL|nr:hypothetical protein EXIGLDRAFT_751015 [Exidia glandulosa HHB12029]